MFASLSVKYTFELGGNCVTADYERTTVPRMISVVNRCKPPYILSALGRVEGIAMQSPDYPGAFSVSFGKMDATALRFSTPGNYWIIKLGPIVDGAPMWLYMHSHRYTKVTHSQVSTTSRSSLTGGGRHSYTCFAETEYDSVSSTKRMCSLTWRGVASQGSSINREERCAMATSRAMHANICTHFF